MNDKACVLLLFLFCASCSNSSSNNTAPKNYSLQEQPSENYSDRITDIIIESFNNRQLDIDKGIDTFKEYEKIIFLRIMKNSCDPCTVGSIEELKLFVSENQGVTAYLIYSFETLKDETNFKFQYDLKNIKTLNLNKINLSHFDSKSKSYFGFIQNNTITEVLAADQALSSDLIQSFLWTY